jgi:hypothetical protein
MAALRQRESRTTRPCVFEHRMTRPNDGVGLVRRRTERHVGVECGSVR